MEFSFDPDAVTASTGNLERDLTQLFVELGETAKEHDTGVVFLIDEMQFLRREEMEAVAAAMHRISQRKLPVALVGTGLPQLPGLMVEAKSYAERLFSYPEIGRLSPVGCPGRARSPGRRRGGPVRSSRAGSSHRAVRLLPGIHSGLWQGGLEHGAEFADQDRRRCGG